jgi:hypothetical protein
MRLMCISEQRIVPFRGNWVANLKYYKQEIKCRPETRSQLADPMIDRKIGFPLEV